MDDFLNAHMKTRIEARRKGGALERSYLYNDPLKDGHFSGAGSEVWAESVGRRLLILMEHERVFKHD